MKKHKKIKIRLFIMILEVFAVIILLKPTLFFINSAAKIVETHVATDIYIQLYKTKNACS